jgi:hypothetical protein
MTISPLGWEQQITAMTGLFAWARGNGVAISVELSAQIDDGFGVWKAGEDPFDALTGMLGMIAVLDGRRPEGLVERDSADPWEGWILGQAT